MWNNQGPTFGKSKARATYLANYDTETAMRVDKQSRIMNEGPPQQHKLFDLWCKRAPGRWR